MSQFPLLIAGLGNPGDEYARHRHNAGFMAVDSIAAEHGFGPWRKRFHGLVAEGNIAGRKSILLKPMTYMNESGRAVGETSPDLVGSERVRRHSHHRARSAPQCGVSCGPRACRVRVPISPGRLAYSASAGGVDTISVIA